MFQKADLFPSTPNEHNGLLVSYWLPRDLAEALALPGGERPGELHLTLCYCGNVDELSDESIAGVIIGVAAIAKCCEPLVGQIAGIGRFNASESSDEKDVFYANVDVPGLEKFRQRVADMLWDRGCAPKMNHGYTPHVTLKYISPDSRLPLTRLSKSFPITIDSISLSVGEKRLTFPLTGPDIGPEEAPVMASTGYTRNALKALDISPTEIRVGNYLALFGGRDLEGVLTSRRNPDGSRGEFFTKRTDFKSSYTDVGLLYVDWEHGSAPVGEPDADDVLGVVDWKSAKIDDKGLFVERVLNRRNKYVKYLEELIENNLLGTSSEAIPSRVQKARNGEILRWPLRRDTLTVVPMEPRMMIDNPLSQVAMKALSQRLPSLASILDQAETSKSHKVQRSKTGRSPVDQRTGSRLSQVDQLELELSLLELGG